MLKQKRSLLLASASPRRAELLRSIGIDFNTIQAAVDETPQRQEHPVVYTSRLALAKALAGLKVALDQTPLAHNAVVLGADTIVTLNGELLGKPCDEADAKVIWRKLGGSAHEVVTAVALADGDRQRVEVVTTKVWFDAMTEADMVAYWASGEPADKAGAYGIQGLGAIFVPRIEGSYTAVVGLPLRETWMLLREFAVI